MFKKGFAFFLTLWLFGIFLPPLAAAQSEPLPTPDAEGIIYIEVQSNDSLWSIAARAGLSLDDVFSWRRSTDFEHVKAEVAAVRDSVGMMEISGFCKFMIRGAGARAFLDRMLACRIPGRGFTPDFWPTRVLTATKHHFSLM